jgi:hypothetical protein
LGRRDEKEPMGSSTVVYQKRGHGVRDETVSIFIFDLKGN